MEQALHSVMNIHAAFHSNELGSQHSTSSAKSSLPACKAQKHGS